MDIALFSLNVAASRTVKLGGTVATEKQMMKYE